MHDEGGTATTPLSSIYQQKLFESFIQTCSLPLLATMTWFSQKGTTMLTNILRTASQKKSQGSESSLAIYFPFVQRISNFSNSFGQMDFVAYK